MINYFMHNLVWILPLALVAGTILKGCREQSTKERAYDPIKLDPREIKYLADLAVLAYADNQSNLEWRMSIPDATGLQDVRILQSSGIDAFMGHDGKTTFIVIRGTAGMMDLLSDVWAGKCDADHGQAHAGFYRMADRIWNQLGAKEYVAKHEYPICISGHSLGAGAGSQLAEIALSNSVPIHAVMAMSAPRSSDLNRSNWIGAQLGSKYIRVTFSRDPVPLVPPAFMGFRHIGYTHYFDRLGGYHSFLTTGYRILDLLGAILIDWSKLKFKMMSYHNSGGVRDLIHKAVDEGRMPG